MTLLSSVLSQVNVKARYGWSDKNFSSLLQVVRDMLPEENKLPKREKNGVVEKLRKSLEIK